MSRVIAIVNQKGGVGKTTTANNLATALAATKKKILLIDNDPQGNTTTGFGIKKETIKSDLYRVLVGETQIQDSVIKTSINNLDIIPASVDLAAAELELVNTQNFRHILQNKLAAIRKNYDYIIIDCPPSLGILTINALVASDSIIIPLQCEFFALEGLKHLIETYKIIRRSLNTKLIINGIILTMYDRRNNITTLVEQDVRSCLGSLVYSTVIPRNVRLSEAPSHGKPILIYDVNCTGSIAYIDMAKEFLQRERTHKEVNA